MSLKKKEEEWISFPERHPWIPVIFAVAALIAAYAKG